MGVVAGPHLPPRKITRGLRHIHQAPALHHAPQRYHGWIVTGTFTVALKLVPSRWVHRACSERSSSVGAARATSSCGAAALLNLLAIAQSQALLLVWPTSRLLAGRR